MTDGWRPHIENALCLSLPHLMRSGWVKRDCWHSGSWNWSSGGERVGSIRYQARINAEGFGELRLIYTTNSGRDDEAKHDYPVRVVSEPMRFGGRRLWLICPYTGHRALKLYKFSGIDKFCHRTAIRPLPTYAIQRVSKFDRVVERQWAIRRSLGDPGSCFDPLSKPSRMRWSTFEKYAAKDAQLDAEGTAAILRRFKFG